MNINSNRNRLQELLADEAAAALEPGTERELRELLQQNPGVDPDEIMQTAALLQLACLRRDSRGARRLPADLRQRLAARAPGISSHATAAVSRPQAAAAAVTPITKPTRAAAREEATNAAPRSGQRARFSINNLGWALAAMLAVAFVVVRTEVPAPAAAVAPQTARASLLNEADDVVVLPWTAPVPGYEGVSGDVVWSESRQQGFLRLAGMPVNDPASSQYQLWIVSPERDRNHPVDGGVFDVGTTGEVVIPIQAKLHVSDPKAFAITAEQPGGVVVSAGPLLLVASG